MEKPMAKYTTNHAAMKRVCMILQYVIAGKETVDSTAVVQLRR